MVLVDANILIDLFTDDQTWAEWSSQALADAAMTGEVIINPIIYAEVSIAFKRIAVLDKALAQIRIAKVDLPYPAAFIAGKAFLEYRKRGGVKRSPLPDFYIGAHAQHDRLKLLTRDPRRYQTYFPKVELVSP